MSDPSRQTAVPVNRRGFFRVLTRGVVTSIDQVGGAEYHKLADLVHFPDEKLEQLVACVPGPVVISFDETGHILGQLPGQDTPVVLFEHTAGNTLIYNSFNGTCTLKETALDLAKQFGLTEADAFRQVKQLFLHLISLRICQPG